MLLAQAAHHGAAVAGIEADLEAGVFFHQAGERLGELLLVRRLARHQREAEHRLRPGRGGEVVVVLVVRVVQHRVAGQFVDARHRAKVAGHRERGLDRVLALHAQQVGDLEGLAAVADVELRVGRDLALMHAEQAELAAVGVVGDLEDVGDDVALGVEHDLDGRRRSALALEEGGHVGLGGVGGELAEDVEQLAHAGAATRGDEAHRHQVAFAQGLLEGGVELLGVERLALLEVLRHQRLVEFDDLVDDRVVRRRGAGEGGGGGVVGGEEAVDDAAAVGRRQVDRQALAAEGGGDGVHQRAEVGARGVDLVDHDHAALALRGVHHAPGAALDAGRGVDHHRGGVGRGQRHQGATAQVGQARGVEQVDPVAGPLQVDQRRVQRVAHRLFLRVEVGDRVAALHAAGCADLAGGGEQGLDQGGLAAAGVAEEGQVADVVNRAGGHRVPLSCD